MGLAKPELRAEAIRLRLEQRLSLREIEALTGAARGSLSMWLRPYPLTDDERRARSKTVRRYVPSRKSHGAESKYHQMVCGQSLSRQRKGRIAEVAILLRLTLHGLNAYASVFDGDKTDWIVEIPETGKMLKLQVRCVNPHRHGLPGVLLTCTEGHNKRRRYQRGEFDFIVGYYLFNDTAYVFSFDEVMRYKTYVTIAEKYAERWDKLRH